MVSIDEIQTEVVMESDPPLSPSDPLVNLETQKDLLRDVVRELLREELDYYLRTEARD